MRCDAMRWVRCFGLAVLLAVAAVLSYWSWFCVIVLSIRPFRIERSADPGCAASVLFLLCCCSCLSVFLISVDALSVCSACGRFRFASIAWLGSALSNQRLLCPLFCVSLVTVFSSFSVYTMQVDCLQPIGMPPTDQSVCVCVFVYARPELQLFFALHSVCPPPQEHSQPLRAVAVPEARRSDPI